MVGCPSFHREPATGDDSRARRVEDFYSLPGLDRTIILVSAGSIVAGLLERPVTLRASIFRQEVYTLRRNLFTGQGRCPCRRTAHQTRAHGANKISTKKPGWVHVSLSKSLKNNLPTC